MNERARPENVDTELLMLRAEHRALDVHIARLIEAGSANQIELQRLKRQKLAIKDRIARVEHERLPDIIA
jgi:hypothetical protein